MASAYDSAPKTALPATMALAPASITLCAFAGLTPPSTSIHGSTPASAHIFLMALIFATWLSMKPCPPKPGLTDMTRMRSTQSSTSSMALTGVPGLSTTPDLTPRSLIWFSVRCRWMVAAPSQCTEMMSLPALAKSATRSSGSTIMRCVSSGLSVMGRSASTTSGPMVMLGTNRPSMTSTCTQSHPASSIAFTCAPSSAKLAERMDGETMISFLENLSTRAPSPWARTRTERQDLVVRKADTEGRDRERGAMVRKEREV
mmetsp:Transcript_2339/g.5114  ORF Transcript_2339/g.5114 Transcript_2339/m.5114 type:complete len:259 (+) Transcript_2339:173-949(+)